MPIEPIAEADDPRLAPYQALPGRRDERQTGVFVTEGDKVTERMLRSGWPTVSLLVEPAHVDRFAALAGPDVPVLVAERELIVQTIGFHFARGVLGCGRRPTPGEWRRRIPAPPKPALVVVTPATHDPTNLASIIRTSAAFGADCVVVGAGGADPFSRRVVRVSMGAAFQIPIVEVDDPLEVLRRWRAERFLTSIALTLGPDATPLDQTPVDARAALWIGNEAHGLPRSIVDLCDGETTIPIVSTIDSLNAAVAAGIAISRFARTGR